MFIFFNLPLKDFNLIYIHIVIISLSMTEKLGKDFKSLSHEIWYVNSTINYFLFYKTNVGPLYYAQIIN